LLKLENTQPGGSFKIRGIGNTMQEAVKNGVKRFVGSSGGNAGMAMAVAAEAMNVPLTIYVPESTNPFMVTNLRNYCENVVVVGKNWNEANAHALKAQAEEGAFLVHPYDQATTWDGNSTLVQELYTQMDQAPGCIVASVGGGGLAQGVLQGLESVGWSQVPLLTMETEGADCYAAARRAGHVVKLPGISSIATSLGALSVSETLFNTAHSKGDLVMSRVVTDDQAKQACVNFADQMRMLVEPACGAALAAVYAGILPTLDLPQGDVVIVVCGGNIVKLELVNQWRDQLSS